MAVLMIAAVSTLSAFATIPEDIFFNTPDFDDPASATNNQAQHSVTSAVNTDGNVVITFSTGPATLPAVGGGVGQYYGVISALSPLSGANVAVNGDYTTGAQTVSYTQIDTFVPIEFTVTFTNVNPNGPASTVPHQTHMYYVAVE
jgi:hypothetical protein